MDEEETRQLLKERLKEAREVIAAVYWDLDMLARAGQRSVYRNAVEDAKKTLGEYLSKYELL